MPAIAGIFFGASGLGRACAEVTYRPWCCVARAAESRAGRVAGMPGHQKSALALRRSQARFFVAALARTFLAASSSSNSAANSSVTLWPATIRGQLELISARTPSRDGLPSPRSRRALLCLHYCANRKVARLPGRNPGRRCKQSQELTSRRRSVGADFCLSLNPASELR